MAIIRNIQTEPRELINGCTSALDMWNTLVRQYKGTGHNLKHQYFQALVTIDYK